VGDPMDLTSPQEWSLSSSFTYHDRNKVKKYNKKNQKMKVRKKPKLKKYKEDIYLVRGKNSMLLVYEVLEHYFLSL
jgi:hypothetical protein